MSNYKNVSDLRQLIINSPDLQALGPKAGFTGDFLFIERFRDAERNAMMCKNIPKQILELCELISEGAALTNELESIFKEHGYNEGAKKLVEEVREITSPENMVAQFTSRLATGCGGKLSYL